MHKTTEHFLGTCLFTPSCFTLFRGEILDKELLEEFCDTPRSVPRLATINDGREKRLN